MKIHVFPVVYTLLATAGCILFVPFLARAATVDVTEDVELVLPSDSSAYTMSVTGGLTTVVVNNDNFVLTIPSGSTVKLTSTAKKNLTNDASALTQCGSDSSTVTLALTSGESSKVVTITPSGSCSGTGGGTGLIGGSSGGSGGGGGGGGGGYTPVTTPAPQTVVAATPPVSAAPMSAVFAADMKLGDTGNDVSRLQELLKTDPTIYPDGRVTGYYGALTKKAVQKFQQKYGLSAVGRVGPQTRAKLEEIFGNNVSAAPQSAPPPLSSSVSLLSIMRGLDVGAEGADVKALQEYLAQDSSLYPQGKATGYYGSLTKAAVGRFQEKYGLAVKSDSGYGYVGPKTRAKLLELTGK